MLDFEFVQHLIRALDESSLDSLEIERGGTRIRLSKSATPCIQTVAAGSSQPAAPVYPQGVEAPAPAPAGGASQAPASPGDDAEEQAEATNYVEVTSPMVGTFYRAPSPEAPPYVDVGSQVGTGSVLCIIEAMKLMNELESDVKGTVVKILVENAEPVEYGQVLFLIDPS